MDRTKKTPRSPGRPTRRCRPRGRPPTTGWMVARCGALEGVCLGDLHRPVGRLVTWSETRARADQCAGSRTRSSSCAIAPSTNSGATTTRSGGGVPGASCAEGEDRVPADPALQAAAEVERRGEADPAPATDGRRRPGRARRGRTGSAGAAAPPAAAPRRGWLGHPACGRFPRPPGPRAPPASVSGFAVGVRGVAAAVDQRRTTALVVPARRAAARTALTEDEVPQPEGGAPLLATAARKAASSGRPAAAGASPRHREEVDDEGQQGRGGDEHRPVMPKVEGMGGGYRVHDVGDVDPDPVHRLRRPGPGQPALQRCPAGTTVARTTYAPTTSWPSSTSRLPRRQAGAAPRPARTTTRLHQKAGASHEAGVVSVVTPRTPRTARRAAPTAASTPRTRVIGPPPPAR